MDKVDCDVAPLIVCHLMFGRPWQFDINATREGRSNYYYFMHKGVKHVLKLMPKSAIKAEVFPAVKNKKGIVEHTSKPRMDLLKGGENNMTI